MRAPEHEAPGAHRRWAGAAALALGAHAAIIGAVLAWSTATTPVEPEPVVLVELPEGTAAPAAQSAAAQVPRTAAAQSPASPQIPKPEARAEPLEPRLRDPDPIAPRPVPVTAPRPVAVPQTAPRVMAPSVSPVPPAPVRSAEQGGGKAGNGPGTSPAARKAQQDYYAMIAAHLQRRKSYPTQARKARQQGTVTIRFTVARDGSVSNAAIKTSSGHELLDAATLELLQRVAPLPRMPASMEKDTVTLSLPIDYALHTD